MDTGLLEFQVLRYLIEDVAVIGELARRKVDASYFTSGCKGLLSFITDYYGKYSEPLTKEKMTILVESYPTNMKTELLASFDSAINTEKNLEINFLLDALVEQYKDRELEATLQESSYFFRENRKTEAIARLREGIGTLEYIGMESYDEGDISDSVDERLKRYKQRKENIIVEKTVFTGFPTLDRCTYGISEGEVFIFAGDPKSGKSFTALNVAHNVWKGGGNVVIFSAETAKRELELRHDGLACGLPITKIRLGKLNEEQEALYFNYLDMQREHKETRFHIIDAPGMSTLFIRNKLITLQRTAPIDLVIIDYLGLLEPAKLSGNRWTDEGKVVLEIFQMARLQKLPILAIDQLSKESKKKGTFALEDMAGSYDKIKHANVIIMFKNLNGDESDHNPITEVEAAIRGSRKGPTAKFHLQANFTFGKVVEQTGIV